MTRIDRAAIDTAIENKAWPAALAALRQFWRDSPGLAGAQLVLDRIKKIEHGAPSVPCRLAVLRSFTLEPALPMLRASCALHGIDLTVQVGDFNTYVQDILTPTSDLYSFDPHVVILAVQTRDLLPELWSDYTALARHDIDRAVERATGDLRAWIHAFRIRSQASLIIHDFEIRAVSNSGILDSQMPDGQSDTIRRINRELRRMAAQDTGVFVLDYDGLVSRFGRDRWHDERKWLTARMPIAADCLVHLADEYARYLIPLMGRGAKALIVDLDNTLWGGVVGEDGLHGIKLGPEYPGAAFLALQRTILDLYQRGIILAVCSKNNPADAMEVLEQHPHMLLRPRHFAALRINWVDKALNLRELAQELNIGIDALAFLDDNPAERERIRLELPEVHVIELPQDPMDYARAVRESAVFERLTLSAEDRERGRYYAEQRQRTELAESASSLEDFYRSLKMRAEIADVTAETLARTAQLTQKTNQFNLTTRRYSEQQIEEMSGGRDWRVYTLRVLDRFGDNGLVGVAITHQEGEVCEIDTFLLSCRVIGRTVETALLAHLARQAAEGGAARLVGSFLPTKKNAPARDFYPNHGFYAVTLSSDPALMPTASRWELRLPHPDLVCPEWIEYCTVPGEN